MVMDPLMAVVAAVFMQDPVETVERTVAAEEAAEAVLVEPAEAMAEMADPVRLRRARTSLVIPENRLSEIPWRLIRSLFPEI